MANDASPVHAPAAQGDEYHLWNPPQYQPEASDQEPVRLSPWETAQVYHMGLHPHDARAHLDSGQVMSYSCLPSLHYLSVLLLSVTPAMLAEVSSV